MTSSICWIDRDGLAETLARLGLGHRETPIARPQPLASAASSLGPAPAAGSSPAPFAPPPGPLRERLEAFLDWLASLTGARVAFIVDRDGLPLVDRQADADLLAIASAVMQLIVRINRKLLSAVGQAVAIQLEEGQLILLSVATPIGEYIIGYVGTQSPDRETQKLAARALERAFRPSGETRPLG